MDGINRMNFGATQARPTPLDGAGAAAQPAAIIAPPQPAPPPSSDRVTINSGETPAYKYTHERDGQGVEFQTWNARSGIKYEVASKGDETRFHVDIPQGLAPAPIELSGAGAPGQQPQLAASPAGHPEVQLPVQMTPDGKYLIGMSPNGAVAMFDPQTMDFGLSTPPTQTAGPNGQPALYQPLQEIVHPDASRTVKAHTVITEQAPGFGGNNFGLPMGNGAPVRQVSYLQIDESATGQVSAKQVVERDNPAGSPAGTVATMLGGSPRQEKAVSVQKQPNGSFAVSTGGQGGSLLSHMKASLQNPMTPSSPLLNWWKDRKQGATQIIDTFQSNPGLLTGVAAMAGPAAAMGMGATMNAGPGGSNVPPPPPGFPR